MSKLVCVNIDILDETGALETKYKSTLKKIARVVLKELQLPKGSELCISFIAVSYHHLTLPTTVRV